MDATLLRGELVRLAAPNPETDAETVAAWSRDAEFHRTVSALVDKATRDNHFLEFLRVGRGRVRGAQGRRASHGHAQCDGRCQADSSDIHGTPGYG